MLYKSRKDYEVEDFLTDESFTNYYFQLNTADELSWKEWLAANPSKTAVVKQAKILIQTLSITPNENEYQVELAKITNAINVKKTDPVFHTLNLNERSKRLINKKTSLLFLIPLIAIIIVGGYLFSLTSKLSNQLIETVNTHHKPMVITLSDSTIVTLAPQSVLQYPEHFENNIRDVYLKGEAQFNVQRNEKAPFKVYSGSLVATVLGTIFTFRKSGDSTVVELLKGKLNVQLTNEKVKGKPILLSPSDKAIYVLHDHHFYKEANTHRVDIHFSDNNFTEIATRLKEAFGVTVINRSNKTLWRFTGKFTKTTAKEVMESICLVKGLTVEAKGDTFYIK